MIQEIFCHLLTLVLNVWGAAEMSMEAIKNVDGTFPLEIDRDGDWSIYMSNHFIGDSVHTTSDPVSSQIFFSNFLSSQQL